ncbi:YVTN repeat-like/Quino protein amine dehydrogenase [Aspergillus heteromorphus CBS 117.55]|uniref:YVTN repeat-like/Quino protein amine dehydrogenase n=1 Tax=Aspergillus heteromorphus CBS 117.55 TaxID=1448321 RepID=A0A317WVV6_9EURO|nr:YVTN repeat-like/Quino protein amine dehydrogenase [Aspergillus heteromorphus CBS 117.55]PWY89981.1 YVTN repeat-like/Quino protein amine dehydrogenase [Aspergillus heteromorphus CBS 117.55]
MDSTGAGVSNLISLAEDGDYAVQLSGKDLIIHLDPASPEFKEVQIIKLKENGSKFLKFSRSKPVLPSSTHSYAGVRSPGRRVLCANESRVGIWQLDPLQRHAEIESIEPGATYVDFGGDENEIIFFHAWNTKITVFALDSGRSQIIRSPKFSSYNGFGYRPKTRQLAVLLKPDATDLLTVHEFRSYELIGRATLPTIDAQGLKWSPDGRWIAVWDAASAGTRVLVYTADGQLFRAYSGPPGLDKSLDLGVRGIEWGPVTGQRGVSELLAVGKIDGTVDVLKTTTFSCSISLSHVFQIEENPPSVWRERYADGDLEYAEASSSSAFGLPAESTGPLRGVSIMSFSANGKLLSTVDQTRPNILWIWDLESTPVLLSALVHEHAIRQAVWHPSKMQLLITTASTAYAAVRYWSPYSQPLIARIPVPRSETGRYDVRWLSFDEDDDSKFWFGTPDDYVLGHIEGVEGTPQFKALSTINGKSRASSYGPSTSR